MALGAGRRDVLALILGDAVKLLAIGLATGAAASLAAAQAARTLLFGLSPNDPVTLLMGAAGLGAVALLASYLPARRAARLEPTIALREESSSSCSTRVGRHLPVEIRSFAPKHM
jgi:putative ABC transport system permease protein